MKGKMKRDLVLLAVLIVLVLIAVIAPWVLVKGVKVTIILALWLGQNLSALLETLKGGMRMWFDIIVIVGAIVFNIYFFLKGLKLSKKREVLKWTLMITCWYSLAGNAIICWLLPLIYLSNGILWQEIFKWSLRYGAMGLAAYYYLMPLFRGAVKPNQVAVREFLWAKNRKDRVKKLETPSWGWYPPFLFDVYKESAEIEKVEVPILEVLSKRARRTLPELEDRIMLDEAILSVRYRIVDLKKLIPKMGRKKAEDYIKDKAVSLLRAQIGTKSLAATLDGWKTIESQIKQEMVLFKNFGVNITSVIIDNLKVPSETVKNKEETKKEQKETQKEKQNTSDDSEDDAADRVEPKKKGIAGVVVGVIVVLIVAAITIPIITSTVRDVSAVKRVRTVEKPRVQQTFPKSNIQMTEGVQTLRIPANRRWTDTGIDLKGKEEKVLVVAEGTWDGSGGQAPEPDLLCGAEGIRAPGWINDFSEYPLSKNRIIHNLIGRIGRGKVFHLGESFEERNYSQGRFYLGINDYIVRDNDGFLDVTIKVER